MDGEDAMEESYIINGKSIGKGTKKKEKYERKGNRGERIGEERGTVSFSTWIMPHREPLCKAGCLFIFKYKSDSSL